jgi:hypothetical protein
LGETHKIAYVDLPPIYAQPKGKVLSATMFKRATMFKLATCSNMVKPFQTRSVGRVASMRVKNIYFGVQTSNIKHLKLDLAPPESQSPSHVYISWSVYPNLRHVRFCLLAFRKHHQCLRRAIPCSIHTPANQTSRIDHGTHASKPHP